MFAGKTALVTGGSRGIGLAITRALHTEGAKVIVVGRKKQYLDDIERELQGTTTIQVDLTDWDATEKALSGIGSVDLLVNNAGIFTVSTIEEITESDVNAIFDINIKAVINVTKCVLPAMKSRGSGCSIVNMSSIASTYVSNPTYATTKAALDHLTRHMAVEFGKYKIRVNAINPGLIQGTDIFDELKPELKELIDDFGSTANEKTPTGAIATLSDCVDLVLFLLSDKSKAINGECTIIDGGFSHVRSHIAL